MMKGMNDWLHGAHHHDKYFFWGYTGGNFHVDHHRTLYVGAHGEYQTIQSAVDAAHNGDLILVAAGTYAEQVTIVDKVLTIQGTGDATHIVAPATLTANIDDDVWSRPSKNAIIGVDGGDVTLKNLSVDGLGNGNHLSSTYGAADYEGIYYHNASGTIDDVSVTGIREPLHTDGSLSGNQLGNGILISNQDGVARTVEVHDTTVTDFQKTGIVFDGDGLTVDADHNTVVGNGLQPLGSPAQNGIQVSRGATGTVEHNDVSNLGYGPDSYSASGILVYGSDNVHVDHNNVSMVGDSQDAGIAFVDADSPEASYNHVTASYGIYQQGTFDTVLLQDHNQLDSSTAVGFYPDQGGPYHVTGTSGNDELWGAGANDVLNGGRGNDTLVGDGSHLGYGTGEGNDTFVFDKHSGNDTILDFGQTPGNQDAMDVSAYHFHSFAQLQQHITDDGSGNAVVQLDAHDSITVEGVDASQLTQQDFIIHQHPHGFV